MYTLHGLCDVAGVLPGRVLGWIFVNWVTTDKSKTGGKLFSLPTRGALDLGGASTQATFLPDSSVSRGSTLSTPSTTPRTPNALSALDTLTIPIRSEVHVLRAGAHDSFAEPAEPCWAEQHVLGRVTARSASAARTNPRLVGPQCS